MRVWLGKPDPAQFLDVHLYWATLRLHNRHTRRGHKNLSLGEVHVGSVLVSG